ncbi:MAG TPA: hypothetical protein VF901_21965 [Bradyrhizobium sp.]
MHNAAIDFLWKVHADELREMWPARVLHATRYEPIGMVVLSMLAHSFDEAMPALLGCVFPGFRSITTPFICSHAKIDKCGRVIADVVWGDWEPPTKNEVIFRDLAHLQKTFRIIADKLKLPDTERVQLFDCAKKWVTADMRLDPEMDPADPDARRLTVN